MRKKLFNLSLVAYTGGTIALCLWSSYEAYRLNAIATTKNVLLILLGIVILIRWFRCGDKLLALLVTILLTESCNLSLQNYANLPFIDLIAGFLRLALFVVSTLLEIILLIFLVLKLKEYSPPNNSCMPVEQ